MSPAETYMDVSAELIAQLLHLTEHDIRIVGARGLDEQRIIRLYLEGDHLPAGPVVATFEARGFQVTLKDVQPAT
jgi:hypothetical protein